MAAPVVTQPKIEPKAEPDDGAADAAAALLAVNRRRRSIRRWVAIATLPLTLAISDGMVVNVGDQTLVVPLANVVESLRPEPHEVQGLGASRSMINVRGRFIPVISLAHSVGAAQAVSDPREAVLIVVETEGAGRAALMVDAICDQRQVVIKSLDTHYRSVEGVAGATILGDGRVALIIDVDGLVSRSLSSASSAAMAEAA